MSAPLKSSLKKGIISKDSTDSKAKPSNAPIKKNDTQPKKAAEPIAAPSVKAAATPVNNNEQEVFNRIIKLQISQCFYLCDRVRLSDTLKILPLGNRNEAHLFMLIHKNYSVIVNITNSFQNCYVLHSHADSYLSHLSGALWTANSAEVRNTWSDLFIGIFYKIICCCEI